jgi:hypothetical protein
MGHLGATICGGYMVVAHNRDEMVVLGEENPRWSPGNASNGGWRLHHPALARRGLATSNPKATRRTPPATTMPPIPTRATPNSLAA